MWAGVYLIKNRGQTNKAHYWTGVDTVCRMWSTGGMARKNDYFVSDGPNGRAVCSMCKTFYESGALLGSSVQPAKVRVPFIMCALPDEAPEEWRKRVWDFLDKEHAVGIIRGIGAPDLFYKWLREELAKRRRGDEDHR